MISMHRLSKATALWTIAGLSLWALGCSDPGDKGKAKTNGIEKSTTEKTISTTGNADSSNAGGKPSTTITKTITTDGAAVPAKEENNAAGNPLGVEKSAVNPDGKAESKTTITTEKKIEESKSTEDEVPASEAGSTTPPDGGVTTP